MELSSLLSVDLVPAPASPVSPDEALPGSFSLLWQAVQPEAEAVRLTIDVPTDIVLKVEAPAEDQVEGAADFVVSPALPTPSLTASRLNRLALLADWQALPPVAPPDDLQPPREAEPVETVSGEQAATGSIAALPPATPLSSAMPSIVSLDTVNPQHCAPPATPAGLEAATMDGPKQQASGRRRSDADAPEAAAPVVLRSASAPLAPSISASASPVPIPVPVHAAPRAAMPDAIVASPAALPSPPTPAPDSGPASLPLAEPAELAVLPNVSAYGTARASVSPLPLPARPNSAAAQSTLSEGPDLGPPVEPAEPSRMDVAPLLSISRDSLPLLMTPSLADPARAQPVPEARTPLLGSPLAGAPLPGVPAVQGPRDQGWGAALPSVSQPLSLSLSMETALDGSRSEPVRLALSGGAQALQVALSMPQDIAEHALARGDDLVMALSDQGVRLATLLVNDRERGAGPAEPPLREAAAEQQRQQDSAPRPHAKASTPAGAGARRAAVDETVQVAPRPRAADRFA